MTAESARAAHARVQVHRSGRNAVDRLARLGLAARGLVYLLVGWLALRIAFLHSGQQADRQGALREVAQHTAGKFVLIAMAVGFAGYALWRAIQAIQGEGGEEGAKDWAKRGTSAARAILYLVFAYSTARLALAGQSGSGSDSTSQKATGGALAHTGGRTLVIVAGSGLVVAGVVLVVRGCLRKFEKHLKTYEMGRTAKRIVGVLGVAGQSARGVVFGMIGVFLVEAAVSFDPHKARGLDNSLRALAHGSWGRAALVAVALGLAAFGLYSLLEARYRET